MATYLDGLPTGKGINNLKAYANKAAFPATGNKNFIYRAEDVEKLYYWDSIASVYKDIASEVVPRVLLVDKAGNDTIGTGSAINPFLTINGAKAAALTLIPAPSTANPVVIEYLGKYNEQVIIEHEGISLRGIGGQFQSEIYYNGSALIIRDNGVDPEPWDFKSHNISYRSTNAAEYAVRIEGIAGSSLLGNEGKFIFGAVHGPKSIYCRLANYLDLDNTYVMGEIKCEQTSGLWLERNQVNVAPIIDWDPAGDKPSDSDHYGVFYMGCFAPDPTLLNGGLFGEDLRVKAYTSTIVTDDSDAGGPTVKASFDALKSGIQSGVIQDILDRYFIPEGYSGRPKKVLPLSVSRAYYFNAICSPTPIFSPNGVNFYYYVSTFGDGAGGSMAFSNDAINWENEIPMAGLTGDGYHAALSYDGTNLHIHYWTGAMNYMIGNVHHAISSPALAHAFSSDAAITEVVPGQILTGVGGTGYRRGTYGPSQMNYNATATNTGTDPRNYTFWGVLGVTDGSKESSILIYSVDGIAFKRWDGRGDIAILPATAGTFYSYSTNQFFPYYDPDLKMWIAYFQGCSSNPNNQNVGLAYSLDLLSEFTVFGYPLYTKGQAEYGQRCYCPCLVKSIDDGLILYKAGRSLAGAYGTYVSTSLITNRAIPILERGKASETVNDSTVTGTTAADALNTLKGLIALPRYTPATQITSDMLTAKRLPLSHTGIITDAPVRLLIRGSQTILRTLDFTLIGNEIDFAGGPLDGLLDTSDYYSAEYYIAA